MAIYKIEYEPISGCPMGHLEGSKNPCYSWKAVVPFIGMYDDGQYVVVHGWDYRDPPLPTDCTWLQGQTKKELSKTAEAVFEKAKELSLPPIVELFHEKPESFREEERYPQESAPHARTLGTVKFFDGTQASFCVTFRHMINWSHDRAINGPEMLYGRFPVVEFNL